MVLQRTVGGNTLYYLGQVNNVAFPSYFPVVFLMKEPITYLAVIFGAFVFGFWNFIKGLGATIFRRSKVFLDYLGTHFPEFAMIFFVVMYWVWSISSNLNIGVRHLLPTMPFIYILSIGAIRKWFGLEDIAKMRGAALKVFLIAQNLFKLSVKSIILVVMVIGVLVSLVIAHPYYLSYYNLIFGGTQNGYRYVVDSNYDWGQDLKRLQTWANNNIPPNERIAVDYSIES